jgi:hypothetical protein
VNSTNGIDTGPLAGWAIALVEGTRLIGRLCHEPERLEPVYELHLGIGLTPQGVLRQRQVFPLLTFASIQGWVLRSPPVLLVEHLSLQERRELANAVSQCEAIVKAMRADEAGVVLATDMPKMPARRP